MKKIPLSQGKFALVDESDYDELCKVRWWYSGSYPARDTGGRKAKRRVYMHRVIMNAMTGEHVDHINGDKLDNRRSNLRIVTNQQNSANSRARSAHGYKGVTPWGSKWVAQCSLGGKNVYCGIHETKELAAKAYDVQAKKIFPHHARLNFPDEP